MAALSATQILLNKNSEAVLCLQRRDYGQAIGILHGCLREDLPRVETQALFRQLLHPQGGVHTSNRRRQANITDDGEQESEQQLMMSTYAIPVNVGSRKVDAGELYNAQGGFHFFDQAIVTTSLEAEDGEYHPRFVQAILLYNIALALHQQAIMPPQRGHRLFSPYLLPEAQPIHVASHLYELALQAVQEVYEPAAAGTTIRFNDGGIQQEDIALLLLAINNNLAHIHGTYFSNFFEACLCVERIKEILSQTGSNACSIPCIPRPKPFSNSETWRFFYHNIITVPSFFCHVSGAA